MDENNTRDVCPHHYTLADDVAAIRSDIREVLRRLGSGDVSLATLDTRLRIVERVTFGAVALILTGVIVAGLCLVVRM